MIDEIKLKGISRKPSDYVCEDGRLAASVDLISEDGGLRPVPQPSVRMKLEEGERCVALHKVSEGDNILTVLDGKLRHVSESGATEIADVDGLRDIAVIGNTVAVADEIGLKYILWKDGAYKLLGARPPLASVAFGSVKMGALYDDTFTDTFTDVPDEVIANVNATSSTALSEDLSDEAKAALSKMTDSVYGTLLSYVASKVTTQGYFYQPFFVRYAYRLYDGSYAYHSAPVLMVPTATRPLVYITGTSSKNSTLSVTSNLKQVNYFSLAYKIEGTDGLQDWSDIVAGVDIFVSAPLYLYDQSKSVKGACEKWKLLEPWEYISDNEVKPRYVGTYAEDVTGPYTSRYEKQSSVGVYWNIPEKETFESDLTGCSSFYLIKSIDVEDFKDTTSMALLEPDEKDLTNLVNRTTLPDDYQSRCTFAPRCLKTYNARLNMADVELTPAVPYPPSSMGQYENENGSDGDITVWTSKEGETVNVTFEGFQKGLPGSFMGGFPRYVYYPDASAKKMRMAYGLLKTEVTLKPHDFLNGAYWYGGFSNTPWDRTQLASREEPPTDSGPVRLKSKIYTSDASNPFVFQATNINTVGTGRVLALSSAAKALSQGQFGQFPMYAFTDEGVWAMEISSSGGFSSKQPITRDVCLSKEGVAQLDSAVMFATRRGVMLLSGSEAVCLSEEVNGAEPFDLSTLKHIDILHKGIGHEDGECLKALPLTEYLSDASMLYDYPRQRVIVFSPSKPYAYVYSLKSKEWGTMTSDLKSRVDSYPEALANDGSGNLVDFTTAASDTVKGLFITRPMKMGTPDVLKTLRSVIIRGMFEKKKASQILYGSRDLYNWFYIASSSDRYLRGMSGTPYKYFRVAASLELTEGEDASGISLEHLPRMTDRLR